MTNLEKYNNILKRNLQVADEDLNDDVLVTIDIKNGNPCAM